MHVHVLREQAYACRACMGGSRGAGWQGRMRGSGLRAWRRGDMAALGTGASYSCHRRVGGVPVCAGFAPPSLLSVDVGQRRARGRSQLLLALPSGCSQRPVACAQNPINRVKTPAFLSGLCQHAGSWPSQLATVREAASSAGGRHQR